MDNSESSLYDDEDSDLSFTNYQLPKEQEIALECWGRVGYKLPSMAEIFIPSYLLKKKEKKDDFPEVRSLLSHKLEDITTNNPKCFSVYDSCEDNFLPDSVIVSSISNERVMLNDANTDICETSSERSVDSDTNCRNDSDKNINNMEFNTVLPQKKGHSKGENEEKISQDAAAREPCISGYDSSEEGFLSHFVSVADSSSSDRMGPNVTNINMSETSLKRDVEIEAEYRSESHESVNFLDFSLYNTVLPRKGQSEDEKIIQKPKSRKKKKNKTQAQNALLSAFLEERKSIIDTGYSKNQRYAFNFNCHLPNNSKHEQLRKDLPDDSVHSDDSNDNVVSNCYRYNRCDEKDLGNSSEEYPTLPSTKLNVTSEPQPNLPKPTLTIKSIVDSLFPVSNLSPTESVDTVEAPTEPEEIVKTTCLIIENIPKDTDCEEAEMLLQSFGQIKKLLVKDMGDRLTMTVFIDSDLEWMVECLDGSYTFGDFSEALKVYESSPVL